MHAEYFIVLHNTITCVVNILNVHYTEVPYHYNIRNQGV